MNLNTIDERIAQIAQFKYPLDEFQIAACEAILDHKNVLVTAHTGSGKSTLIYFSVAYALNRGTRALCTTPIKSLSNQLFRDLKQLALDGFFGAEVGVDDIGISTGDIKVNPDAKVLVATAEIIRNQLFAGDAATLFENVGSLSIDEVHYITDEHRGAVWEETISALPRHVQLTMLSATIPGVEALREWSARTTQRDTVLVSTKKRHVPLTHSYYCFNEKSMIQIMDKTNTLKLQLYDPKNILSNSMCDNAKQERRKHSLISSGAKINRVVDTLVERDLTPALFFVFSRVKCERFAKSVQRTLIDASEQSEVENLFDYYVRLVIGPDTNWTQQIWEVRALVKKGVAFHHSGLLPVLKETIETLCNKKLVRVLFVTDTFACGISCPVRTVVFTALEKHDGVQKRCLEPDEYTQIAGRAGRRSVDTQGTVIYAPIESNVVSKSDIARIMGPRRGRITSKFQIDMRFVLDILVSKRNADEIIDRTLAHDEFNRKKRTACAELERLGAFKSTLIVQLGTLKRDTVERYNTLANKLSVALHQGERKRIKKEMTELRRNTDSSVFEKALAVVKLLSKIETDIFDNENTLRSLENERTSTFEDALNTLTHLSMIKKHTVDAEKSSNESYAVTRNAYAPTPLGLAASAIRETHGIVLASAMKDEVFDDLDDAELAATLIMCVDESDLRHERVESAPVFPTERIENRSNTLKNIIENIATQIDRHGSRTRDAVFVPHLAEYGYYWILEDMTPSYNDLKSKVSTDLYEGNFVKTMLKFHNLCEEAQLAATYLNKTALAHAIDRVQSKLIRNVVVIDSLYVRGVA